MLRDYMESSHPIDIATVIFYTGIDPFTGQEVYVAKACGTGRCSEN